VEAILTDAHAVPLTDLKEFTDYHLAVGATRIFVFPTWTMLARSADEADKGDVSFVRGLKFADPRVQTLCNYSGLPARCDSAHAVPIKERGMRYDLFRSDITYRVCIRVRGCC